MQILVFRGVGWVFIVIPIFNIQNRQFIFGTAHPYIAIFRGSTFFLGFTLFFISLSQITLAEATSLFLLVHFLLLFFLILF